MKKTLWIWLVAAGWLMGGNAWARAMQDRDARQTDDRREIGRNEKGQVREDAQTASDKVEEKNQGETASEGKTKEIKVRREKPATAVQQSSAANQAGDPQGRTIQRRSAVNETQKTRGLGGNRGVVPERQADFRRNEPVKVRQERAVGKNAAVAGRPLNRPFLAHRPKPIEVKKEIIRTPRSKSVIAVPRLGPDNKPFKAKVVLSAPRADRMVALRNPAMLRSVDDLMRRETVRGRYYWHNAHGHRFCHYYDNWGYHWYGWWWGGDYHWTRYHSSRWWWYDNRFDRWCWWHDGYWWWQDPVRVNVIYVYNDGQYVPSNEDSFGAAPETATAKKMFSNQAGTRLVKVFGAARDAFLYDAHQVPAFQPVFLASGVRDIRFVEDPMGETRQVVVTLQDGSVALFDPDGNPYTAPGGGF